MEHVLAAIIPLSLAASLSPLRLSLTIDVLARAKDPARDGAAFAAGAATAFGFATLLVLLGAHGFDWAGWTDEFPGGDRVLLLLAGISLVLFGFGLGFRKPKEPREPVRRLNSTKAYYLFGLSLNITNMTSFVPMAVGIGIIKSADFPIEVELALVLFCLLIALLPFWGLALLITFLGKRAEPMFETIKRFVRRAQPLLVYGLTYGLGWLLILKAWSEF